MRESPCIQLASRFFALEDLGVTKITNAVSHTFHNYDHEVNHNMVRNRKYELELQLSSLSELSSKNVDPWIDSHSVDM